MEAEPTTGDMVFALSVIVVYFIPLIIGFVRKHHQRFAILALNLLLGWTGIGWIVALIWSLTAKPPSVASAE